MFIDLGDNNGTDCKCLNGRGGLPGRNGRDGQVGRNGRDGIIGPPGPTGKSGPNGEKGSFGATGAKGEVGDITFVNGPPGQSGIPGDTGFSGLPGLEGPRGSQGETGERGEDGLPGASPDLIGGVTYTRWGTSLCRLGASTFYSGRTGGTFSADTGGASNYLCMPNMPQYTLPFIPGIQRSSLVYGVEYEGPPVVINREQHNAPCAVCHVSDKNAVIMIPAYSDCPTDWMVEYYGYLMSERVTSRRRTEFVCVDISMESIPGSQDDVNGGHFYHVEADCSGLACPPYNNFQELNCVVCTR